MGIPKSKRGGGPRSEAGRLAVSGNALRTGAYAASIVLPDENPQEYAALEEQFYQDFQPRDLAESVLVRNLASLTWRKLRLERIEHEALVREMQRPVTSSEVGLIIGSEAPMCSDWILKELESVTPEALAQAKALKAVAMLFKDVDPAKLDVAASKQNHRHLYGIAERYADNGDVAAALAECSRNLDLYQRDNWSLSFWELVIFSALGDADAMIWAAGNLSAIRRAIAQVKQDRVAGFAFNEKARRAHDDLSRAFFKTLSELRRHQEWRRSRPIDVTPAASGPSG